MAEKYVLSRLSKQTMVIVARKKVIIEIGVFVRELPSYMTDGRLCHATSPCSTSPSGPSSTGCSCSHHQPIQAKTQSKQVSLHSAYCRQGETFLHCLIKDFADTSSRRLNNHHIGKGQVLPEFSRESISTAHPSNLNRHPK